jgi:hypothetical protein
MSPDTLRDLLRRQPFVPFELRMTNGDRYLVAHPELALLAGSRLVVHYPESDRLAICSLLHIAAIEMVQPA